jgi:hypothetical protein
MRKLLVLGQTYFFILGSVTERVEALLKLKLPSSNINGTLSAPKVVHLRFPGLQFKDQADGLPAIRYLGSVEYLSGKVFGYTLVAVYE